MPQQDNQRNNGISVIGRKSGLRRTISMTIQHHTHPKSLFPCFLREEGFPYQPILSDEDMKTIKTGEPSFTELIESGSVYVDKTAYINKLLKMGQSFYFLSRPRRYGKSLFCSTLHALFDGRKELFKGLYIAEKTNPISPLPRWRDSPTAS